MPEDDSDEIVREDAARLAWQGLDALRWTCVCGCEMPFAAKIGGLREPLRFCGVCGKPRDKRVVARDLRDSAVFHVRCRVGFDSDLQVTTDGRSRGLWLWTRTMNMLEQDTENAVLLEWDQVHALRLRIARAERQTTLDKLILQCAAEFRAVREGEDA